MTAITSRHQIPEQPTLFLFDEAAQIGHFPPLVQAITLGRGYGIRTHTFWQDMNQLLSCYPTEWRTILNNSGVKQVFGLNDPFMAQGLDELFQMPMSTLISLKRREQWLMCQGKTSRAVKLDYLRDRDFQGLYDPNPYYAERKSTNAVRPQLKLDRPRDSNPGRGS